MKLRIKNVSGHPLPAYQTKGAAGLDLMAHLPGGKIRIAPLHRLLISTGLFIELPEGYEGQIRPRSGLALRHGVTVLNAPGTIDSDYRGELKVLLINLSDHDFEVSNGDRIAQLIIAQHETVTDWELVDELTPSERGSRGYGSTGRSG